MKSRSRTAPVVASSSGTALHRQLYLVLRDQIVRGLHPAGSLLPSVEELGKSFNISGITIRRALTDLAAAGYVERKRGLGTFVTSQLPQVRQNADAGFIDSLGRISSETKVRVLGLKRSPAPEEIASLLHLPSDAACVNTVRLRSMARLPLMVTDAWIPADIGGDVTMAELRELPLYEILMKHGIQYGRVIQEITAVLADPRIAKLLSSEVSGPLIRMTRLFHDERGRPIQYLTAYITPERSRILMDLPTASINMLSGGQIVHDTFPTFVHNAPK